MTSMTEKEYYNLTISMSKALNPMETPLKLKHVRSVIIMTHKTKQTKSIWSIIMRQPLMENRFTAWKFCHLLHKVLREGHESALKQSQTHKKMILEMGKSWGHLQDGVGVCIQSYSKLIVTKLEFHEKNPRFPGSLIIDYHEIEKFAANDINLHFQLCVELFDYLDDIIDVQSKVFQTINAYRMSSMSPQGQCRLAPLITLIQDSNALYDLSVRGMFKLHDHLTNDTLSGHQNRFREIFFKLKNFYDTVRPLQYFADLIQVPRLPESAPNFTSKLDFGSYVPPVVYVQPEPEPDIQIDSIIDISANEDFEQTENAVQTEEINRLGNDIKEKESTIKDLGNELCRCKDAFTSMEDEFRREISQLQNEITFLNNELSCSRQMYSNLCSQKDNLELKLASTPVIMQKAEMEEERAKSSEEKFAKLKTMYTQIRDEHINLLRQHGETTKQLNKENTSLKYDIVQLEEQISKHHGTSELVAKMDIQSKELEQKLKNVSKDYESLRLEYQILKTSHADLETTKNIQDNDNANKLNEWQKERNVFVASIENFQNDLQKKVHYAENLESKHLADITMKDIEIHTLKQNISIVNERLQEQEKELQKKHESSKLKEIEYQVLIAKNDELQLAHGNILANSNALIEQNLENEKKHKNQIQEIITTILEKITKLLTSKINETDQQSFTKTIGYLNNIDEGLKKVKTIYSEFSVNNHNIEESVRKFISIGFNYSMLHEQCISIYNTTTQIESGEEIFNLSNQICKPLLKFYSFFISNNTAERNVHENIQTIDEILERMRKLIQDLKDASNVNIDLGDLVETELDDMSKAIEEATQKFVEMLSCSRSRDNGVKLEVNERILDACTTLMKCIKQLIKKSKVLQEEIISTGRGSTSVKEFYKRNSQWTEGLISASKSVAKGANLLVQAANKAVTSDNNNNFEIIVAAQEIAACTAQLVIASKVKAPKDSQKLTDLTKASRNVSQATGIVVATVKDCNQDLEQAQEVDLSKLTSSQAKTMEMEIHVKVLELENALQRERLKLSTFRKNNYQNTED